MEDEVKRESNMNCECFERCAVGDSFLDCCCVWSILKSLNYQITNKSIHNTKINTGKYRAH